MHQRRSINVYFLLDARQSGIWTPLWSPVCKRRFGHLAHHDYAVVRQLLLDKTAEFAPAKQCRKDTFSQDFRRSASIEYTGWSYQVKWQLKKNMHFHALGFLTLVLTCFSFQIRRCTTINSDATGGILRHLSQHGMVNEIKMLPLTIRWSFSGIEIQD